MNCYDFSSISKRRRRIGARVGVIQSAPASSTVLMKSIVSLKSLWIRILTETVFLSLNPSLSAVLR